MKKTTAAYWVATGLVALLMSKSAVAYLTQDAVRLECHRLGFPDYFRVELAVAKLLGVLALLAPVGVRLKEWAYAGFTILLVSALIAHPASGEPLKASAGPAELLVVLAVSYWLYRQRQPLASFSQPG
ncbi:DoxX family protein [Hymenobacter sp. HMF4947]|uniref:DoxX family protein n=1 Tax=Hymenobacter ginkgonis TaxID=2682976 RepID=A0A7K1TAW6_9BACT|nr:DoxX family protein [Hymenobacter ginkgonis]MVN75544.1 DoxX family protein [Hymenobacter ginkgonis]